jgi:hypothetical protein
VLASVPNGYIIPSMGIAASDALARWFSSVGPRDRTGLGVMRPLGLYRRELADREVKAPLRSADHVPEAPQGRVVTSGPEIEKPEIEKRAPLAPKGSHSTLATRAPAPPAWISAGLRGLSGRSGPESSSRPESLNFVPEIGLAVDQKLIKHRARGEVCSSQSLSRLCGRDSQSLKDPKHSIGGQSGSVSSRPTFGPQVTRTSSFPLMARGRQAP